jgi:hypothetical protein
MASTAIQSPFEVAEVNDIANTSYVSIQEEFETLPGVKHPLISRIKYGEAVSVNESMQIQVVRDKLPPVTLSLTAQVDDSATSLTLSTTEAALIQEGQILFIDEELLRATTIASSTTVGVSRGFASSVQATHVTSSVVHLLSPLFTGEANFVTSPFYRGEMVSFNVFRTQYGFEQSSTSTGVVSYLTKRQNQVDFEKDRARTRAMQQMEYLALYGKAQAMSASAQGSPDGLYRLITSNVNTVSGLLTGTDLVDTIDMILAHNEGARTEFEFAMNHNTKRIVDAIMRQYFDAKGESDETDVGVTIDRFKTSLGTITTMTDRMIRDGEIYVVDWSDVKLHPLKITDGTGNGWVEFKRGPEHLNKRSRQVIHELQALLVMGEERKHALIKGFTTTGSSYAGYV